MSEQNKLYRVHGNLYRREPARNYGCAGCALHSDSGLGCGALGTDFSCMGLIAKLVPPSLPVPASVPVVEC